VGFWWILFLFKWVFEKKTRVVFFGSFFYNNPGVSTCSHTVSINFHHWVTSSIKVILSDNLLSA